ncbi:MAG TPA: PDZ domain-containing protein [Kofleriaceae bacterium]
MRWASLIAVVVGFAGTASADRKPPVKKPLRPYPQVPTRTASVTLPAPPPPSSNPAFLGIKMENHGLGCQVIGVTPGSAAQDAGLREWDLILALDGVQTSNCNSLHAQIVANAPGHVAKLDVRRGADRIVVNAPLSTRAEVLHRRLVGQSMESTNVIDADDDKRSYNLAETNGKTTIVGWFTIERCAGCNAVFDRINDGIAKRLKDSETAPFVLAVSPEPAPNMTMQRGQLVQSASPLPGARKSYGFTTAVPLALASDDTFTELAIDDPLRVHFMVIDCRGVVRFVAPIAPGSDDIDAAIDEVLAAAEQAEHSRTQRR